MSNKLKQNNIKSEEKVFDFDVNKLTSKFDMNSYNEDYVITNNILKYHMKSIDICNYEKNRIYDKKELDVYKEKIISKYNVHYYPYELYFNSYKNIYQEEKVLLNVPKAMNKTIQKENDNENEKENEKENEDKDENEEKEKHKDENISNACDEEIAMEDDYIFDYNKSDDDLENDDHDENVI
ncbi:conserved Plasmodium protein, unknown function [Plasmodium sp. gorilla clade G2]|uniref:conserved Plasmodium protein, unknown function n=1 Tax=Plasmodium sp. gorilla clade G2 TaxID=880535 RepID=UPI000D20DC5F|nr:conserved Plasmodium protein, unknown function [Plasmodium sp. gorilla clade G2]SOV19894.1 conserved Plasmodium protein, unknown function [Plasmodium sp. gorilla clade G2]